jgi:hypothetical protein
LDHGADQARRLVAIKVLHTAIWLFFVGCIAAIPVAGAQGQFGWAAILTGVVLVECLVLATNQGRCPLFDIYLPSWLARHNSLIFGSLFAAGVLFTLCAWLFIRQPAT